MDDHPVSDDDLLAYAFGESAPWWVGEIAAHGAVCSACAGRLARVELVRETIRADSELGLSAETMARVKALNAGRGRSARRRRSEFDAFRQVVASLTFDGRFALGGLRGGAAAYLMSYSLDDIDVDLEFAPSGDGDDDRWQVTGQISAANPAGPYVLAFAEAGNEETVVEMQSDEDGMFFADLTAGSYDLLIQTTDAVVVLPDLAVG